MVLDKNGRIVIICILLLDNGIVRYYLSPFNKVKEI